MADWQEVGGGESEMWDKEKPIQGTYVNSRSNVGPKNSMVYTIKTAEGEVGVWGSSVLNSKFEQITKGSEVRITHLGMATSKGGNEYHDYKVEVKPQEGAPAEDVKKVQDALGGEVI